MTKKKKEENIVRASIKKTPIGIVSAGLFKGIGSSMIDSSRLYNPYERTAFRKRKQREVLNESNNR